MDSQVEISTPEHLAALKQAEYQEKRRSHKPKIKMIYYERVRSASTGKEKYRQISVLASGSKYSRPCKKPDLEKLKKEKIPLHIL